MAFSKKRKVDSENRAFNPEWTDSILSLSKRVGEWDIRGVDSGDILKLFNC